MHTLQPSGPGPDDVNGFVSCISHPVNLQCSSAHPRNSCVLQVSKRPGELHVLLRVSLLLMLTGQDEQQLYGEHDGTKASDVSSPHDNGNQLQLSSCSCWIS